MDHEPTQSTQSTQSTQPPTPSEDAETFLLELRVYGEAQARLRNLQRARKGKEA